METATKDDIKTTTTKTAKDLIRESELEKLASAPVPEVKYETVSSCDGYDWRRKDLGNGQYGKWERLGRTK